MTNDEKAEMIAEINGNQRYCKNCDDCCKPYNSADDCFKSAMEMAEWKDEQFKTKIEELFNELEKAGYNDRVKSGFEIFKNKIDEELLKAMEEE